MLALEESECLRLGDGGRDMAGCAFSVEATRDNAENMDFSSAIVFELELGVLSSERGQFSGCSLPGHAAEFCNKDLAVGSIASCHRCSIL